MTRIVIACAAAILLMGAYVAQGGMQPAQAPETHSVTITYTDDGFEPHEVTVRQGESVRFVTYRSKAFWPASDLHPSHQLYAAFDPRRPLFAGEVWSFTFDKPGDWRFHDHLEPAAGGIVHVGDTETDACVDVHNQHCWRTIIFGALSRSSVHAAMGTLAEIYAENPSFATLCHEHAHDIGLQTYRLYGTEVGLTPKIAYCNGGFLHGYLEGYLGTTNDLQGALAFCARVRKELEPAYPFAEELCFHGIGHGAMEIAIVNGTEHWSDFASLVAPAIETCSRVTEDEKNRRRCAAGAFGVLRDWAQSGPEEQKKQLRDVVLFDVCRAQNEHFAKKGCYWAFAKVLSASLPPDILSHGIDMRTLLGKDDWDEYGGTATESWAVGAARYAIHAPDAPWLFKICRTLPDIVQPSCVRGLAEGMVSAGDPRNSTRSALVFCSSSRLRAEETRHCFNSLQSERATIYSETPIAEFCDQIPAEFQDPRFCHERSIVERAGSALVRLTTPFVAGHALRANFLDPF